MVKIDDLISYISPSIRVPGGPVFGMAVLRTAALMTKGRDPDTIRMSAEVYGPVAEQTGKSVQSVIKSVDRVTDIFWRDGQNAGLNQVIGRELPVKPYPREFVLYCAYFLAYGKPYHKSAPAFFGTE